MILKKTWAIVKWIFAILFQLIPFGFITGIMLLFKWWGWVDFEWKTILYSLSITSYVGYIFVYPLRKPIRWVWYETKAKWLVVLLWVYLDDTEEHDYGTKTFLKDKKLKIDTWLQRYWASWRWSADRNPWWNHHSLLKPKQEADYIMDILSSKGRLVKNGTIVGIERFAGFKYVDKNGKFMDNTGEFLSIKYSILGWSWVWYYLGGTLYWRFSTAKISEGKHWWEIHLGTNEVRFTWRLKHYTDLIVFEYTSIRS